MYLCYDMVFSKILTQSCLVTSFSSPLLTMGRLDFMLLWPTEASINGSDFHCEEKYTGKAKENCDCFYESCIRIPTSDLYTSKCA